MFVLGKSFDQRSQKKIDITKEVKFVIHYLYFSSSNWKIIQVNFRQY